MIKVNDKWFRVSIVIFAFAVSIYTNGLLVKPFGGKWIATFFISLSAILLICEGNRWLICRSRKMKNRKLRLPLVIPAGTVFTAAILALSTTLHHFNKTGEWENVSDTGYNLYVNSIKITASLAATSLFNGIVVFLTLLGVYEAIYHFARLRHTEKQKQQLEKEKLKAELNQLKGIVNPHFLFNNLNSLSSLISENPLHAEAFLDELTKVFRYLLRNNETEMTTLAKELEFIQSYYHLLQTRYGSSIELKKNIDEKHQAFLLPPLTLQLLIENAVKHNRLQKENPLVVELISSTDDKLIVRNNISKKESKVESTGIGLQSINTRYRMLNLPGAIIEQDSNFFSIIIPLVERIS